MIRRRLAMRLAFTNRPEGKGYAQSFGELMRADGLDTMDKTSISAVLWFHDDAERLNVLREIREAMTPGERSRLNSPISARQRVEKLLAARSKGESAEEKLKDSPVVLLKRKVAEQEREIATLRERLAKSDGSLFDLKNDSAADIVAAIATNVGGSKAETIAKGLIEHVKRKRKARSGLTAMKQKTGEAARRQEEGEW